MSSCRIPFVVRRATVGEKSAIGAMLSPYLAELGVGNDYPYLPYYWTEPLRIPYLFEGAGGSAVGFALIRRGVVEGPYEMAEFYILPEHRRDGAGRRAAHAIFDAHRGLWKVSVLLHNERARKFWQAVIGERSSSARESQDFDSGKIVFEFEIS